MRLLLFLFCVLSYLSKCRFDHRLELSRLVPQGQKQYLKGSKEQAERAGKRNQVVLEARQGREVMEPVSQTLEFR